MLVALLIWPIIDPWMSRSLMQWHSLIYAAPGLATELVLALFPIGLMVETPMWIKTFVAYIPMCILFLWPLVLLLFRPAAWQNKRARIAMLVYTPVLLVADVAAAYYLMWWVRNVD